MLPTPNQKGLSFRNSRLIGSRKAWRPVLVGREGRMPACGGCE